MALYTSKVVAQYLNLTERRVRQLRDEGVIREKRPGLYDLIDTMSRYIKYIGSGSKADLNVQSRRLEVTCGEAPFLASRYDAATGEMIPVARRMVFWTASYVW